jgi:4-hydroxy-tetrahydrodipicolinate synthase
LGKDLIFLINYGMTPLTSNELFGNWATLILPIALDESIRFDALEREIDTLIAMKVNGIYSNGTAGEFYAQTEDEFGRVSDLLAKKCNAERMPFQIGCSHVSPQLSLERVRHAKTLKPSAIQVILPDWYPPTLPEIMDFLEVMAAEAHPIGLVLYNPPHAKMRLTPGDFGRISGAGIPLVGCKVAGGDASWYADMQENAPDLSVFVPGHTLATGVSRGAKGSYSNVACLHPAVSQEWYAMMMTDIPTALEMEKRILHFIHMYVMPLITGGKYSSTAIDKFLAAIGNWADIGTRVRWPYKTIPDEAVTKTRDECRKILPEFFKDYHV